MLISRVFLFTRPVYIPVSPEIIKSILVKDFQVFTDRGMYFDEKRDPLSANLFALEGTKWKHLRSKLTPTFTSGKMKLMFSTLLDCCEPLKEAMDRFCETKEAIDIKEVLGCFTTDVIGSCAFGLECNSFKNPDSEFRRYGKGIFKVSPARALRNVIIFTFPALARPLRLRNHKKEESDFFINLVKDTVEYREKNNVTRKDFMQLLIDLKKEDENGEGLTIHQMAAQAFVFFIAGFETSSTTMSFCLYELSINEHIQNKVREEVKEILDKHGGKMTYEAMQDMKYLGQVIDGMHIIYETLRKYPPGTMIARKCSEDYPIEGTDVVLEKGTGVMISILGLHKDPEYFPNPEKFDPDRYNDENRVNIPSCVYMPFGEGPRICIGQRFGLMQTKVGLATLLKDYKFLLNSKTISPLVMDRHGLVLSAKGGIWLNAAKIS
ncbi:cytochrome p450 [Rhyzopertha dominica]|nr:cytochrome p450 [Rhyzopertha dominica]